MDLVQTVQELFYFLLTKIIIFIYIISSLEHVHFYCHSVLITPEDLQLFRFVQLLKQIKKKRNKTKQN